MFDIAELREVTAYDKLELDTLGDRKTALFLIMSDTDDSFNFLISMCYERWAKVYNLKQMAQTVNYLREHGLLNYDDLKLKSADASHGTLPCPRGSKPQKSAWRRSPC